MWIKPRPHHLHQSRPPTCHADQPPALLREDGTLRLDMSISLSVAPGWMYVVFPLRSRSQETFPAEVRGQAKNTQLKFSISADLYRSGKQYAQASPITCQAFTNSYSKRQCVCSTQ